MSRAAFVLTLLAASLTGVAAACGLLVPGIYQDPAAMVPVLRGQDLVTLAFLPVLVVAAIAARRASGRGLLAALGVLGYLLYTYIGAAMVYAFNALFPVYVAALSLAAFAFATTIAGLDAKAVAAGFADRAPRRILSVFLAATAAMVAVPELAQLAGAYAAGTVPEIVTRSGATTSFVHALDLGFIAPLGTIAAVLLWRRRPAGYVLAAIMLVKEATMGLALMSMTWFSVREGYPLEAGLTAMYGIIAAGGLGASAWLLARWRKA